MHLKDLNRTDLAQPREKETTTIENSEINSFICGSQNRICGKLKENKQTMASHF